MHADGRRRDGVGIEIRVPDQVPTEPPRPPAPATSRRGVKTADQVASSRWPRPEQPGTPHHVGRPSGPWAGFPGCGPPRPGAAVAPQGGRRWRDGRYRLAGSARWGLIDWVFAHTPALTLCSWLGSRRTVRNVVVPHLPVAPHRSRRRAVAGAGLGRPGVVERIPPRRSRPPGHRRRGARDGGEVADAIPPGYSARTRVHEYGGRCYHGAGAGDGEILVWSNWADQRLWVAPGPRRSPAAHAR